MSPVKLATQNTIKKTMTVAPPPTPPRHHVHVINMASEFHVDTACTADEDATERTIWMLRNETEVRLDMMEADDISEPFQAANDADETTMCLWPKVSLILSDDESFQPDLMAKLLSEILRRTKVLFVTGRQRPLLIRRPVWDCVMRYLEKSLSNCHRPHLETIWWTGVYVRRWHLEALKRGMETQRELAKKKCHDGGDGGIRNLYLTPIGLEPGGGAFGVLTDMLSSSSSTVTNLRFSICNNDESDGMCHHRLDCAEMRALTGAQNIVDLNLGFTKITTAGVCALAKGLPQMRRVKRLNLMGVFIDDDGMREIRKGLERNMSLEELLLSPLSQYCNPIYKVIEFYLDANRAGRHRVLSRDLDMSLWPLILVKSSHLAGAGGCYRHERSASVMYFFLRTRVLMECAKG